MAAAVLTSADLEKLTRGSGSSAPSVSLKTDDLHWDLGSLMGVDSHPVDAEALARDGEAYFMRRATANTQLLIKHIFELPTEDTPIGPVVRAPASNSPPHAHRADPPPPQALIPVATTRLPRSKHVPRPKPLTRWQKFALSKGITKKKKDKMAFDEGAQEWAPRYGYGRKDDATKTYGYELKAGDDPNVDHLERLDLEKQQRVVKNTLNHISNVDKASRGSAVRKGAAADAAASRAITAGSVPELGRTGAAAKKDARRAGKAATKAAARAASKAPGGETKGLSQRVTDEGKRTAIPTGIAPVRILEGKVDGLIGQGKGPRMNAREDAGTKTARLAMASVSTASLGRFDPASRVKGAQEPERPKDPRKLKRLPNEVAPKDEARRHADILRRVLGGSGEGEGATEGALHPASSSKKRRHEDSEGSFKRDGKRDGKKPHKRGGPKGPVAGRQGPAKKLRKN